MYQVKNSSKDNFLLYDQQLAHEIKASSVLKDQLERACENGEFIFSSPKIRASSVFVRKSRGALLPILPSQALK